eukprot:2153713-Rhodomonas_salina.2
MTYQLVRLVAYQLSTKCPSDLPAIDCSLTLYGPPNIPPIVLPTSLRIRYRPTPKRYPPINAKNVSDRIVAYQLAMLAPGAWYEGMWVYGVVVLRQDGGRQVGAVDETGGIEDEASIRAFRF